MQRSVGPKGCAPWGWLVVSRDRLNDKNNAHRAEGRRSNSVDQEAVLFAGVKG